MGVPPDEEAVERRRSRVALDRLRDTAVVGREAVDRNSSVVAYRDRTRVGKPADTVRCHVKTYRAS